MKDPIERQEAIEVVADEIWHYPNERYKNLNVFENAKVLAEHALRCVPSAQPDLNEWCTDCKEYDKEKHSCPRFNRVIRETLKDAEPERKKGVWIPLSVRHGWICSKCRKENVYAFSIDNNGEYVLQDYFCPNCGADMR